MHEQPTEHPGRDMAQRLADTADEVAATLDQVADTREQLVRAAGSSREDAQRARRFAAAERDESLRLREDWNLPPS